MKAPLSTKIVAGVLAALLLTWAATGLLERSLAVWLRAWMEQSLLLRPQAVQVDLWQGTASATGSVSLLRGPNAPVCLDELWLDRVGLRALFFGGERQSLARSAGLRGARNVPLAPGTLFSAHTVAMEDLTGYFPGILPLLLGRKADFGRLSATVGTVENARLYLEATGTFEVEEATLEGLSLRGAARGRVRRLSWTSRDAAARVGEVRFSEVDLPPEVLQGGVSAETWEFPVRVGDVALRAAMVETRTQGALFVREAKGRLGAQAQNFSGRLCWQGLTLAAREEALAAAHPWIAGPAALFSAGPELSGEADWSFAKEDERRAVPRSEASLAVSLDSQGLGRVLARLTGENTELFLPFFSVPAVNRDGYGVTRFVLQATDSGLAARLLDRVAAFEKAGQGPELSPESAADVLSRTFPLLAGHDLETFLASGGSFSLNIEPVPPMPLLVFVGALFSETPRFPYSLLLRAPPATGSASEDVPERSRKTR